MADSLYRNLTLSGVYRISLLNGSVCSMNGTYYGHTLLFGLYPTEKKDLILVFNGKKYVPSEMKVLNITLMTYLRNFTAPNILIKYPMISIPTPSGNATGGTVVEFNPAQDITVGMFIVIPDLEAVGVRTLAAMDNWGDRYLQKVSERNENPLSIGKAPAVGVMLYSMRVPKTTSSTESSSLNTHPPSSSTLPLVLAVSGGVILVAVALIRRGKR